MSVDLLMSSHFLAVECHDIFFPGGDDGILGNRMGRIRAFGVNSQLFERGHRLKNGIIAHWSGARERRNAGDGRPEATNQGPPICPLSGHILRKHGVERFGSLPSLGLTHSI
jgi:hypothetical protein